MTGADAAAKRSGRAARRAFTYVFLAHLFVSTAMVAGQEAASARGMASSLSRRETLLLFPATLGLGWFDPIVIQWAASGVFWAGLAYLAVRRLSSRAGVP